MNLTRDYFECIRATLGKIDLPPIGEAAEIISRSLESGGILHLFGTGHSSLLAQEVFHRAGGLVAVYPILDPRLSFESGARESTEFERSADAAAQLAKAAGFRATDAGIVISNSGRNALPIEMALRMRAAGMKVIALTSLEHSRSAPSRHSCGKRLFEVADAVLDNHCPPGDAAITVAGMSQPLGPLSTIVGAAILHATFIEAAARLAARGKPPAAFASANLPGVALEDLDRLTAPFQDRIRYYRPHGGRPKPGA